MRKGVKSFRTGGYTTSDPIDYNLLDEDKKNILLDTNNSVKLAQLILKGAIINMITPEIVKQAIFNNSIMAKKLYLYCNDKGTLENTGNRNINTDSASRTLQELINRNIAEITFDFFIKMIKNDLKQKYSDIENNHDNFKEYFKKLLHWNPSVLNIGEEGELARNMLHIHDKNDFILKYIRGEIIMDITQEPVVFYIESNDTLIYKVRTNPHSDSDDGKKIILITKQRTNIFIEYFKPIIISELPDISILPDHILSRIDPIFLANKIVDNPSIKNEIIERARKLDTKLHINLGTIINAISHYKEQYEKTSKNLSANIHHLGVLNNTPISGAGENHKSKKKSKTTS